MDPEEIRRLVNMGVPQDEIIRRATRGQSTSLPSSSSPSGTSDDPWAGPWWQDALHVLGAPGRSFMTGIQGAKGLFTGDNVGDSLLKMLTGFGGAGLTVVNPLLGAAVSGATQLGREGIGGSSAKSLSEALGTNLGWAGDLAGDVLLTPGGIGGVLKLASLPGKGINLVGKGTGAISGGKLGGWTQKAGDLAAWPGEALDSGLASFLNRGVGLAGKDGTRWGKGLARYWDVGPGQATTFMNPLSRLGQEADDAGDLGLAMFENAANLSDARPVSRPGWGGGADRWELPIASSEPTSGLGSYITMDEIANARAYPRKWGFDENNVPFKPSRPLRTDERQHAIRQLHAAQAADMRPGLAEDLERMHQEWLASQINPSLLPEAPNPWSYADELQGGQRFALRPDAPLGDEAGRVSSFADEMMRRAEMDRLPRPHALNTLGDMSDLINNPNISGLPGMSRRSQNVFRAPTLTPEETLASLDTSLERMLARQDALREAHIDALPFAPPVVSGDLLPQYGFDRWQGPPTRNPRIQRLGPQKPRGWDQRLAQQEQMAQDAAFNTGQQLPFENIPQSFQSGIPPQALPGNPGRQMFPPNRIPTNSGVSGGAEQVEDFYRRLMGRAQELPTPTEPRVEEEAMAAIRSLINPEEMRRLAGGRGTKWYGNADDAARGVEDLANAPFDVKVGNVIRDVTAGQKITNDDQFNTIMARLTAELGEVAMIVKAREINEAIQAMMQ